MSWSADELGVWPPGVGAVVVVVDEALDDAVDEAPDPAVVVDWPLEGEPLAAEAPGPVTARVEPAWTSTVPLGTLASDCMMTAPLRCSKTANPWAS